MHLCILLQSRVILRMNFNRPILARLPYVSHEFWTSRLYKQPVKKVFLSSCFASLTFACKLWSAGLAAACGGGGGGLCLDCFRVNGEQQFSPAGACPHPSSHFSQICCISKGISTIKLDGR